MIDIKRAKVLIVMYSTLLIFLTGIILNISAFKSEQFTHMAANQRTDEENTRCMITDRNLIPFTGKIQRYSETTLARHIIGYTDSSGSGISGIEKAIDKQTQNIEGNKRYALKDGKGNEISVFKPVSTDDTDEKYVKLTLDYHIQSITENVLDNYGIIGAAVVMDVDSFDVLAMASRPNFSADKINEYISSNGTELLNRALSQYNAGSIFKIVTMATALEKNLCPTHMFCGGFTVLDGIVFPCHNSSGHSWLASDEAFAQSCNCAFYQLGTALGSNELCNYSKKFGLGKSVLNGKLSESNGNIPPYLANTLSESANLSIGQGEILITPLQAAKLACIIASGGISKSVNILDSITTESGKTVKSIRDSENEKVISESNAKIIGEMMKKTVESGTGTNAKSNLVSIAGKTGSAETGWQTESGYMVQGWFIGFFPYEAPKYAMAVMVENGRGGNTASAPLFKEIAERITSLNR